MKNQKRPRRVQNKHNNLHLARIEPLTENQQKMFDSENHLVVHGSAGTGKTFVATYLGLDAIMRKDRYSQLIYIRSAVPTRNMGFLPGTDKEKSEVYETPYKEIAFDLFGDANAYNCLKEKGTVKFMTTSFIRGTTLDDCVIIVDECQNMTLHELDSIITRAGENCRIFFCGDMFQNGDLGREESGLGEFFDILHRMSEFDFIEFSIADVVRSGLVKSYLTARYKNEGRTQ